MMSEMSQHLTVTGPEAGMIAFCGERTIPGTNNAHLPYGSTEQLTHFVKNHIACEKCRQVFYEEWEVNP